MNIFNSIGSNYNAAYVMRSLLKKDEGSLKNLTVLLEKKYQGSVYTTYKGRQAITLGLTALNLQPKSGVAINSFTCIAVVQAVEAAGLTPVLLDCDSKSLEFSAELLEHALKEKNVKAVMIQNSLGYPCDIEKIMSVCKEHRLPLLEDLAHSIGTVYKNGAETGSIGDMVFLSFGQDKVIDSVSGGALIIRNKKYEMIRRNEPSITPKKDMIYPILTFIIRATYAIQLGKVVHSFANVLGFLSNPMKPNTQKNMSDWHAMLAINEFINLEKLISHKRKIATIYVYELDKSVLMQSTVHSLTQGTHLRFPILHEKRDDLVAFFKVNKFYLSSIWYKNNLVPVETQINYPHTTAYMNTLLNLPTHINVSEEAARKIVKIVNAFVKSHGKNTNN